MSMSIRTPVLGLDKGKLSLDNKIDIHIAWAQMLTVGHLSQIICSVFICALWLRGKHGFTVSSHLSSRQLPSFQVVLGYNNTKKYQHCYALEESNIFQKLSKGTINKDQEKQGYTLIILKVLLAKIPFCPFQYCKITENQVYHCSKIVRVLGITLVEATR